MEESDMEDHNIGSDFIFSGLSILDSNISQETLKPEYSPSSKSTFHIQRSNLIQSSSNISGSDMDISSESSLDISNDDTCSINSTSEFSSSSKSSNCSSSLLSHQIDENVVTPTSVDNYIDPVMTFLDEEEIAHLLGENIPLPKPEPKETLETENIDTIASFNVRNKYDHITAAELLIREKLTFLSIQEPYASSHKASESWKAFQKLELSSARIECYETPYQIILFDSWKWGGRVISPFQSLQYGRVASIGFDLGNSLKIGIISIYAPSIDNGSNQQLENPTHPTMRITNNLVQKILSKWKTNYPNMITMILGDFQETISTLNQDNLGKYRQQPTPDGVLMGLEASHESIVRKKTLDKEPYVTRFGDEGARGIDHIFFPADTKFSDFCVDAKIQREVGASYFPSDHSLITCAIKRSCQNNNCSGFDKDKYEYGKLFSIKLKQSGVLGKDLNFDFSQFKDSQKYKDQLKLYKEIQDITGNNSIFTNARLEDLEARTGALFKDLWINGIMQKSHGPTNKLVHISENNALELSYILKKFNAAVKDVVTELKLSGNQNNNDSAGKTRGRLRTRKGFKVFNNLPVPTKLRYLNTQVEAKLRDIVKNIYWIKEFNIRTKYGDNAAIPSQNQFWEQWNGILKDDLLVLRANEASIAYNEESAERELHVAAMQYKINHSTKKKDMAEPTCTKNNSGNSLPHVSDNVVRLLNFWLSSSGCNQGFDSSSAQSTSSKGSSAFLTHRIQDWKIHLTDLDVNNLNLSIPHQMKMVQTSLEKAQVDVRKLKNQILKLQTFYRQATLSYFLESKNISSFTNKVSFKSRQAPAAHTSIWDDRLQEFRTCKDEIEELQATSAFHGKWMANSASEEVCAFAEITSAGRLGNRGVKLKPNRVITMADVSRLIPNGNSLPRRIKKSFIRAHGAHTANLFKEPDKDNPHFFYPFFLLDGKGKMSEEENLERTLWKAIATVPTKARFEGFQLAVIGRFASRWRDLLFKIVKLILLMRYIPSSLRKMARFPIPKPGRHNEYRPISLCHDLYCYIMGVVTSYSSAAIERADILHDGLTAYQKGKGCANLVTTELSFREDCLENYLPSVQIDEDEEKFFDRIPVEILLAAMRVNGFPNQGYIEIKASAMEAKTVEIITAKGITYARFVCGLEQGNPDSPTISNLVIKFKHDVWGYISKEIKTILAKNNMEGTESYKFNSVDAKDGQIYLCKIGYSDDNSKYISVKNEEDLLELVRYFTQLSGDISMVTKIGRKSSKCEVQFFNISAKLALKMKKVWSTAWSFIDDSPIEEEIPFKIHLKTEELKEFYKISDFFNLEDEEQLAWNNIIGAKAHKHLGLSSTLSADTTSAWTKILEKMREKMINLNIYKMQSTAQRKCFNMLVGTIPTFVPLQMNFPSSELLKFDKYAASFCLKSNGLSASDSKLRMFLPESMGGIGMISTMELDIISVAREFEILSNNVTLDSNAFRTRISALENYPLQDLFVHKNHAREAIAKLARYGIYVRNSEENQINEILVKIGKQNKKFLPFNHIEYKDSCAIGIGLGKEKNLQLMYGGPYHSVLKLLQANQWKPSSEISSITKLLGTSVDHLLEIRNSIISDKHDPFANLLSFWEWRNTALEKVQIIPNDVDSWKYQHHNSDYADNEDLMNSCIHKCRINWKTHIRLINNGRDISFNQYSWKGRFLQFLINSKSPMIIATDGSHSTSEHDTKTTSSFVICTLDIKVNETIVSGEWAHRPVIPLLSRVSILPTNFGTNDSDIAHGESYAILMTEMALLDIPRITITDSKAIRETMLKVRDLGTVDNDRAYIRSIAGGTGKFICGLMRHLTFKSKSTSTVKAPSHLSSALHLLRDRLEGRNKEFIAEAKSWVTTSAVDDDTMEVSGWSPEYMDDNIRTPIIKVNSHQLNESGTGIKVSPRYKQLIPNLSVLSANNFADHCADYVKYFDHLPYNFNRPFSFFRFHLTCGSKNVDRNISDFCHEQFSLLKVRKLKLKETQGLLWRLLPKSTTTWDYLRLHKGWFRLLLGLSSTHTRRIYKSEIYRECSKEKLKKIMCSNKDMCQEVNNAGNPKLIKILSGCLWCSSKDQCSHKGNRNHAILNCKNKHLKEFREKSTNLIESKFRLFFLTLQRVSNSQHAIECLVEVEKLFLSMQRNNEGKLKTISADRNERYASIATILAREKLPGIAEALKAKNFNFCCEIFGLSPNLHNAVIRDDQIGTMDCAWLGLTPISINTCLENHCNKIKKLVTHAETANALSEDLHHSWKEIKTLIMGRAIGLHRIICSTGKGIEKTWKNELALDINTFRKIKKESNPKSSTTALKRKVIIYSEKRKKRKLASNHRILPDMKACSGITCNRKYKTWCPNNKFAINKIRTSTKQCQRCGRHMTAIKQCGIIVNDMIKFATYTTIDQLYIFIKDNQTGLKFNYMKLMSLMNECLDTPSKIGYKSSSVRRIPDRYKLIGNILSITIKKATQNFTRHDRETLQRSVSILNKIASCKESDFKLTREAEIKIKLLTSTKVKKSSRQTDQRCVYTEDSTTSINNSTIQQHHPSSEKSKECTNFNQKPKHLPNLPTTSKTEESQLTIQPPIIHKASPITPSHKKVLAKFAADIIRPSICLPGEGMMKAVEVIRSFKIPNLYIATAEASNQVAAWQLNQGWTQFAKMFRSRDLLDNKPNGTYLIPMYSGGTGMGHWYLLIVKKLRRRFVRAWCMDSMGKGHVNRSIRQKIEGAFAPGRTTLIWEECETRSQEELECGPRTILAMKIIKEGIEKSLPFETSIQKAALWQHPYNQHTPIMVREEIAHFINQYTPAMITQSIHPRRRRIDRRPPTQLQGNSEIVCIDINPTQCSVSQEE